jgi:hypothetical protein
MSATIFEDLNMATAKEGREQLSVQIDPELRSAIEAAARKEHRTISGQIRHLVVKALESAPAHGEVA